MAVTIHSSPNTYTPSGNPLTFVFSSSMTAQDNFSYQVRIYIDGVLVETNQVFPESGIKAHFDCSDCAERYCNTINPQTSALLFDSANYVSLQCTVQEFYGTPPTAQASASSTIMTYKGKLSKSNFLNLLPSSYIFAASKLWLSLYPRTIKRYINLSYPSFFTFLTNNTSLQVIVTLYDVNDSAVFGYTSVVAATTEVSTYYLDEALLLVLGASQSEIDSTSYITLKVQTAAAAAVSEILTVYIDNRDYSGSAKHLVFLSTIGSLEHFTFIKRSKVKARVKGHEFEQSFGGFEDDGTYSYLLGGVTDFVKEIENTIDVSTDWLSESEQQWLVSELITSPLVYLYDNGSLIRVKVKESGYEYKTEENDMVFQEKITIHTYNDTSTVI